MVETGSNMKRELKAVIKDAKGLLDAYRDLGVDAPPVSPNALRTREEQAPSALQADSPETADTLEALRAFVGDCRRCKLHQGRNKLVFGEGSARARVVFVGEGPGRDEDREGRPFVGEAGKLLTRIIENGMGLRREEVYICNVVKCRPPRNRDPERDEIETCLPFLKRQLAVIKPEVICVLGRVAGEALLGPDFKISQRRGQWHEYMGIPLMPTYHPAYLLRNPSAKRPVWKDVQGMMDRLDLEVKKNG